MWTNLKHFCWFYNVHIFILSHTRQHSENTFTYRQGTLAMILLLHSCIQHRRHPLKSVISNLQFSVEDISELKEKVAKERIKKK